jgi:hypothetical protein
MFLFVGCHIQKGAMVCSLPIRRHSWPRFISADLAVSAQDCSAADTPDLQGKLVDVRHGIFVPGQAWVGPVLRGGTSRAKSIVYSTREWFSKAAPVTAYPGLRGSAQTHAASPWQPASPSCAYHTTPFCDAVSSPLDEDQMCRQHAGVLVGQHSGACTWLRARASIDTSQHPERSAGTAMAVPAPVELPELRVAALPLAHSPLSDICHQRFWPAASASVLPAQPLRPQFAPGAKQSQGSLQLQAVSQQQCLKAVDGTKSLKRRRPFVPSWLESTPGTKMKRSQQCTATSARPRTPLPPPHPEVQRESGERAKVCTTAQRDQRALGSLMPHANAIGTLESLLPSEREEAVQPCVSDAASGTLQLFTSSQSTASSQKSKRVPFGLGRACHTADAKAPPVQRCVSDAHVAHCALRGAPSWKRCQWSCCGSTVQELLVQEREELVGILKMLCDAGPGPGASARPVLGGARAGQSVHPLQLLDSELLEGCGESLSASRSSD